MMYGLKKVALMKTWEVELKVAVLKILGFLLGLTRMDRIKKQFEWWMY